MIVYRDWIEYRGGVKKNIACEGWFLFGFIPLFVRKREIR